MRADFKPRFTATGIGTLPHTGAAEAVADVLARLDEMPYWPQLPVRSPHEAMNLQYAPALAPLLEADAAQRELRPNLALSREEALAAYYERLLAGDLAPFMLQPQEAQGFFEFLDRVAARPAGEPPWVKGHVVGPLTLAAGVKGADGKTLLYDEEVAEAIARGLALAAAAQAAQLAPLGRPMMIFFDEPFLDGYGSAFTPIERDRVVELLGLAISGAREHCSAVLGIHCCGNTDWAMLAEAGAEVINLDSAGYGRHLLLYPQAVGELLARGGAVAWGAVPTLGFQGNETAEGLWADLKGLIEELAAKGIGRQRLINQALVTPACGMGTLSVDKALRILDLTAEISRLARQELGL